MTEGLSMTNVNDYWEIDNFIWQQLTQQRLIQIPMDMINERVLWPQQIGINDDNK